MCTSPITVRVLGRLDSRSPVSRSVPCGKCAECLKKYQNGWKIRLSEECLHGSIMSFKYELQPDGTRKRVATYEKKDWSSGAFLTLTYRDEFDRKTLQSKKYQFRSSEIHSQHSPNFLEEPYYKLHVYLENGIRYIRSCTPYVENIDTGERFLSVSKLHVTNWLKRFRIWYFRKYNSYPVFKYFYCTEYGPSTLRPHAHCIFFGLSQESLDWLRDDWYLNHGHVDFSYFKKPNKVYEPERIEKVANYVSKYSTKGVIFENPYALKGIVEMPSRNCSKGIGLRYILEHKDEYLLKGIFSDSITNKNTKLYDENHFSEDYLRLFDEKLRYVSPCNSSFSYSLPRYYLEKVLGDRYSALRLSYSLYLLRKYDTLYLRELGQIQSQNPTWSDSQVVAFKCYCEKISREAREKSARDSLDKFYKNSKL